MNMARRMHGNSLAAFDQLDVAGRRQEVLKAYAECGPLTDREVMVRLRHHDPNKVRPRITELVKAQALLECGERYDVVSGRRVRICRLRVEPVQVELSLEAAMSKA
jgi:hypothetical protein